MNDWRYEVRKEFQRIMGDHATSFTSDPQGADKLAELVTLPSFGPEIYYMDGEITAAQAKKHYGQKLRKVCLEFKIPIGNLRCHPHIAQYFEI